MFYSVGDAEGFQVEKNLNNKVSSLEASSTMHGKDRTYGGTNFRILTSSRLLPLNSWLSDITR